MPIGTQIPEAESHVILHEFGRSNYFEVENNDDGYAFPPDQFSKTVIQLSRSELQDLRIDGLLPPSTVDFLAYVIICFAGACEFCSGWRETYLWMPIISLMVEIDSDAWKQEKLEIIDQELARTRNFNRRKRISAGQYT